MKPSDDFFRAYGREVSDDWDLLPTAFMIPPVGRSCEEVSVLPKIEYTGRGWAVRDHGSRLSKKYCLFVYESLPSSRPEAYIKDRPPSEPAAQTASRTARRRRSA